MNEARKLIIAASNSTKWGNE